MGVLLPTKVDLNCIRVEELSWAQVNRLSFLSALNYECGVTSCLKFLPKLHCDDGLLPGIIRWNKLHYLPSCFWWGCFITMTEIKLGPGLHCQGLMTSESFLFGLSYIPFSWGAATTRSIPVNAHGSSWLFSPLPSLLQSSFFSNFLLFKKKCLLWPTSCVRLSELFL